MLSRITARFTRSSNTAPEEPAAAPSPRLREAQRKFSGDASQPIKPSTKPSNAQYYASGETDVAPKSSKKSVLFSYKPPKLATVSEDRYGFVSDVPSTLHRTASTPEKPALKQPKTPSLPRAVTR